MVITRSSEDYRSTIVKNAARRYKVLRHFKGINVVFCHASTIEYSRVVKMDSLGYGAPHIITTYNERTDSILFRDRENVVALWVNGYDPLSLGNNERLYVFTRNDTMIRDLILYLESESYVHRDIDMGLGDVTLGADPEYEVFEDGEFKSAALLFDEDDDVCISSIGCDGCTDTLELRPQPASTPQRAVKNLADLVAEFDSRYYFALSVKGDVQALGGHIHVGFSKWTNNMIPSQSLLKALDFLLYKGVLDRFNGQARGDYAAPSAWERKRWGFEYRSLPGAAFAHPDVALFCYTIAYGMAKLYSNNVRFSIPDDLDEAWKYLGATEEMIDKFKDFLSSGWDFSDIAACWKTGVMRKNSSCRITFSDEWSFSAKEWVFENVNCSIPLHLYGLSSSRGIVVWHGSLEHNLDTGNDSVIESRHGFGLPYAARMGDRILLRNCFKYIADQYQFITITEDANVCDNGE